MCDFTQRISFGFGLDMFNGINDMFSFFTPSPWAPRRMSVPTFKPNINLAISKFFMQEYQQPIYSPLQYSDSFFESYNLPYSQSTVGFDTFSLSTRPEYIPPTTIDTKHKEEDEDDTEVEEVEVERSKKPDNKSEETELATKDSKKKKSEKPKKDSKTAKTKVSLPDNKHWTNLNDEQMRTIYGDYEFDITTKFEGTAQDLNKYLNRNKNSVLYGKGDVFMKAQERYNINALAMVAICGKETSCGTTGNAVNGYYNVANISKPKDAEYEGRWRRFDSADSAVMELARLLRENYVDSSGVEGVHLSKLYQINSKYCPVGETQENSEWAKGVNECLENAMNCMA